MKKIVFAIATLVLFACSSDQTNRNPYLVETDFRFDINTDLPLYAPLKTPGSAIYIGNSNVGLRGVIVINLLNSYSAWEASCPNHVPNDCSTTTIEDGILAKCSCEGYTYSLANGTVTNNDNKEVTLHSLLQYKTQTSGSTVTIFN